MPHRLPLFPLGKVLFPGLTMPLHVFEKRYRILVSELLALPADTPRAFGIVGIELGHEVGAPSARQLFQIGCTAALRGVREHEDGRFDLVVEGGSRFLIDDVHAPDGNHPYLRADTTPMPDELGDNVDIHAERVGRLFRVYHDRMDGIGAPTEPPDSLPTAPLSFSYAVAGAMVLDPREKQELLAADNAAARLDLAAALLKRENRILTNLATLPAGQFLRRGVNLN